MAKKTNQGTPPSAPPKFSWEVHGVCPPKPGVKNSIADDDLLFIQEEDSCLNWTVIKKRQRPKPISTAVANKKAVFGKPIHAQVAVGMIIDGLETSRKAFHSNVIDDVKGLFNQILTLNYGITFDKHLVLKILGQPNCEGLRSYLCHRPAGPGKDDKPHYSLVLVGVDMNGYDLNYYDTDQPGVASDLTTSNIPNESLVVEYGHPPDNNMQININDTKHDVHYVLLNYKPVV